MLTALLSGDTGTVSLSKGDVVAGFVFFFSLAFFSPTLIEQ